MLCKKGSRESQGEEKLVVCKHYLHTKLQEFIKQGQRGQYKQNIGNRHSHETEKFLVLLLVLCNRLCLYATGNALVPSVYEFILCH